MAPRRLPSDPPVAGVGSHRQLLMRAAWIAMLGLLVKLAAMSKDIVLVGSFGAGRELDAFLVALAVPLFTWAVVSQTFSSAFVPVLVKLRQQHGLADAHDLIRVMFGKVIVTLALLTIALAGGASWFLPLIAGGFSPDQIVLTQRLFSILLWIVPLSGVSTYWGAILNASNVFVPVAFVPIAIPLTTLVVLRLLVPQYGLDALAWGVVAGYAIELGLLFASMRAHRLPVLAARRGHRQAVHIAQQYGYLFAGALFMSSSAIVDQSMATWLGPGSVSVLNYGYKLVAVLLGTISMGISTAVFPDFCQLAASGDAKAIKHTLKSLVKIMLLAGIPLTAPLMVFSRPIVGMLFERGAMTAETASLIAIVQMCYLLQVPIYFVGIVASRLLTAMGENRTMLRISGVNLAVNVIGNFIFMHWFGVAGIALSTTCVYFISTALIYRAVRSRLRDFGHASNAQDLAYAA